MSSKMALQEEVINRFRFTSTKATHQIRNIKETVKFDRSQYKKSVLCDEKYRHKKSKNRHKNIYVTNVFITRIVT